MAEYNDEIMEHEYDGIQEMDNNLPRWWVWLFYLSIIWGVLYMFYYHVSGFGYSSTEQYQSEMDPSFVRAGSADGKLFGVVPEYHSPYYSPYTDKTPRARLLKTEGNKPRRVMMTAATDTLTYLAVEDPDLLVQGKTLFIKNCASCHGNLGEGIIGPNLTDDYWIHKAGMTAIVKSVKYGFPAKGMIPWQGTLKEDEIINISSYVLTLRGTNPPKPKAPQGDLIADY